MDAERLTQINRYAAAIAEECIPIEDMLTPLLTREEWAIYNGDADGELSPDKLAVAEAQAAAINSSSWAYGILSLTSEGESIWEELKKNWNEKNGS